MPIRWIRFFTIACAALLAGTSFGIWAGLNPTGYTPATYLEQQQHLVRSLHTLMVSLVVAATLLTLFCAFAQRKDKPAFFFLVAASLFFLSCIFISALGNRPVQNEMLTWNADSLPENWTLLRDRWWWLHKSRTMAELIALALIAWTFSKSPVTNQEEGIPSAVGN